jgi:hypothetical protein
LHRLRDHTKIQFLQKDATMNKNLPLFILQHLLFPSILKVMIPTDFSSYALNKGDSILQVFAFHAFILNTNVKIT